MPDQAKFVPEAPKQDRLFCKADYFDLPAKLLIYFLYEALVSFIGRGSMCIVVISF